MSNLPRHWKRFKLKYTLLLALSMLVLFLVSQLSLFSPFINWLGTTSYIGAFISGIFFVSTYTVIPAAYVLHELAENTNIFGVALAGGFGAMLGDYLIFRFVRDKITEEWSPYFARFKPKSSKARKKSFLIRWGLIIIGAIIIASPFPDEVGVGMMGISKIKTLNFLILTFVLNVAGIFALLLALN